MEAGRIGGLGVEWNGLRALLARETRTPMGKDRALSAEPATDPATIAAAIALTAEARDAYSVAGPPPLEFVPDVRPVLDRSLVGGAVLDGSELVLMLPVLDAGPRLSAYGRVARDPAPRVATLTDALPNLRDLRDALGNALDEDGAVTDHASTRLGQVRRDLRTRRKRLVQEFERKLTTSEADRLFADRFVTVRHGRYVLPVRAEARGRVRGIVHDRSQSGQTLFVEPEEFVDANNELVELEREESQEVTRVLGELTDAVRVHRADIDVLVEAIGELDWVFARATLANRMQATAPVIDEDRTVALRDARHPLLVAQAWQDPSRPVVPMDLILDADRPLLVITGPNAGGKTVALKSLALLALMAQTGCHVPAAAGSRLPAFASLHAIIGDDQSVAENLSTFSAFVKQAREVLAEAGPRSLVLLDELGAGTDPDEGAALARAILEALDAAGALVVASTHLEPLKTFASTYPRARNASVEFDAERLAPTFRLRYDVPGQSYALAIAGRLGLPEALIERARGHRSEDAARMSDLLAQLDEHARREAATARTMDAAARETAARLAAAEAREAAAEARARDIVARAKTEATTLLTEIRRTINTEWERLKKNRTKPALEDSRRRLRDVAARILSVAPPAAPAPTAEREAIVPGARVRADHLGLEGDVVSVAGAAATLRAGAVTVRVPVAALRVIPATTATEGRGAPRVPRGAPSAGGLGAISGPPVRSVPIELLLLGKTTDEARDIVEKYLDDAFLAGLGTVRVVHGKGTGALRKAVRDLLAAHPLVESFRDGEPAEGGHGATVAQLRVS
ncbi:MAG: endonuclease MutS2 [Candidatus Rokubacteria bacterium]|nr:endonuclease MutS2 [Candidatus Rokubacteria bacterium]